MLSDVIKEIQILIPHLVVLLLKFCIKVPYKYGYDNVILELTFFAHILYDLHIDLINIVMILSTMNLLEKAFILETIYSTL